MEDELPITVERFISLIEEWPNLWDKSLDNYKNKVATQNSWKEILSNIYPDFETWEEHKRQQYAKKTVKKWTHIRDTFMKSEKKIEGQKMSGSGAKTAKPYVYHKQLSFLKTTAHPNETVNSISSNSETTADTNEEDCGDEYMSSEEPSNCMTQNDEGQILQSEKPPFQPDKPRPKRQPTSKLSAVDAKMLKFTDSFPSKIETVSRHTSLFNGLMPTLDKFDDDQVIDFQLGVLKLMKEIKNNSTTQRQTAPGSQDLSPNYTGNFNRRLGIPTTSPAYLTTLSPPSQDSLLSNDSTNSYIDYTTF